MKIVIVQLLSTQKTLSFQFDDKSTKLSHVTNDPNTNIFWFSAIHQWHHLFKSSKVPKLSLLNLTCLTCLQVWRLNCTQVRKKLNRLSFNFCIVLELHETLTPWLPQCYLSLNEGAYDRIVINWCVGPLQYTLSFFVRIWLFFPPGLNILIFCRF